ncbi:Dicer-like protein 2 [Includes: Endoribonuclease dcl2 [Durusdinium trenchii]|uniref:Dicer-like protein 2 n=1 Tax=Durusdinium trenchii TaxID=1381693 RepID=A0ABP0N7G3_9DINO
MANLMRLVSNAKEKPQPRVLGLTASFFCGNMKRKRDAEKAKMEMELLLGAGFLAPEVSEDAHHQSTDYEEVHWRASSYGANFESEIQPGLSRMAETLGDGADVKDFQRLGLRMNHVFKQLGRNALSSYTQHCIVPQFREKANTVMMAETVSEEERRYHKSVLERLPDLKNWARTFHPELLKLESVRSAPEISPKVDRLLQLLEQEPLKGQKGIVFVEQVSCTVPLALTISQRLGIHAEAAYGQMSRQDLNKILDSFKDNETKVVVSTNALEEGIDVDSCSWVVRFDRFNTTKDHIQGSGRARASKAKIFYFDNDPQEEVSKERAMEEVAKDSRNGLTDEERRKLTEQRMPRRPTVHGIYPYTEEGGHQIHLFNGKEIVMRWCQQVLGIGFSAEPFQTEPEIRFEIPTPEGFRTFGLAEVEQQWQKVQLQEIVPTERLKEFSPRQRTELRSFYAVAVWLRKQGFLDQHHEPVVKHLELAKASCPPKKPELLLKLDGRKFERPAQALDNQRVVNYKAALQELLQQKYQTPLNELLRYSASMEDGGWIAQVTVSAEKEFSQTSHVCRTKKEAEQEVGGLLSGLAEEWDAKAILRARIRNEGILFLRKVKGDALAINVAGAEHNVDVLAPLIHKATVADGELHLCTVPDFEKQYRVHSVNQLKLRILALHKSAKGETAPIDKKEVKLDAWFCKKFCVLIKRKLGRKQKPRSAAFRYLLQIVSPQEWPAFGAEPDDAGSDDDAVEEIEDSEAEGPADADPEEPATADAEERANAVPEEPALADREGPAIADREAFSATGNVAAVEDSEPTGGVEVVDDGTLTLDLPEEVPVLEDFQASGAHESELVEDSQAQELPDLLLVQDEKEDFNPDDKKLDFKPDGTEPGDISDKILKLQVKIGELRLQCDQKSFGCSHGPMKANS